MKREKSAMKEKIRKLKERISIGNSDIPACVKSQCLRYYLLAGALFVVGLVLGIVQRDPFVLIASFIPAFAVAIIGYIRELDVSKNGYFMIRGRCEKIEYTLTSKITGNLPMGREVPSRYLIRNELFDNELYAIPYFKQNPIIYEGDMVASYYRRNVKFMNYKGALVPDHLLGYEILPFVREGE